MTKPIDSMWTGIAVFGTLALLSGCAGDPPPDETPPREARPAAVSAPSAQEARTAPPKLEIILINPTLIEFEKMSIALDAKAKETITQIAEKARTSGRLTVTGHCDRRQVRNAADAAVARAVVTRDELIAQGVRPSSVVVKFSIETAQKHAAEIRFEELELTKKPAPPRPAAPSTPPLKAPRP